MEKSFHSASWYRVQNLKLRLRRHARLYRTHYRGQLWYVLQDRTSGRFHRFSPSSYMFISMMDGTRTVQEIWDIACAQLDDETLTQDEVIRLLGQLHSADVLFGDIPPDIDELAERGQKMRTRKLMMSMMNPLAIRLPLLDPDAFITATFPLVRPLFSIVGALVFLAVAAYGLSLAATNWEALTTNVADRVLTAQNIAILILCYCAIKAVHELGHAYAVKRWGGEVHEIGIMFLVFMPVPYVDASDSMSFHSKWQRALVGGAGIIVEVFLASLAMIVWANAEDGLVRAFAFNTMLIGGISTLLFNGNPLLKFDGYYVLSDILEIPNLAQRANRHIGYIIKRYAFGMEDAESPATAPGEPFWFTSYATLSFLYRLFITVAIVTFVSSQFFSLGIILAIWAVVLMFGVPLAKHLWFLLASPQLRRNRGRAFAVTGGVIGAVMLVLFSIPLPHATIAEGVVWVPGERIVHAEADGVVVELVALPGEEVAAGAPLVRLEDPMIDARARLLESHIEELERRAAVELVSDLAAKRILEEELRHARGDRDLTLARREDLTVRADAPGTVILPRADHLVGRFLRKGEVIGYVSDFRDPLIRVIVPEEEADLVRSRTTTLEVRYVSDPGTSIPAEVVREVPALTADLPSLALATDGGGQVALDPGAGGRRQALSKLMHLDLRLPEGTAHRTIGERVYVRFAHEDAPIAAQLYRSLRQVFLRQFDI